MNQEPHIHPIGHQYSPTYHGFWPMFLIGLSLLLIFAWEIWVGVDTRRATQQLQERQVRMVDQAKHAQASLEKLVRGAGRSFQDGRRSEECDREIRDQSE